MPFEALPVRKPGFWFIIFYLLHAYGYSNEYFASLVDDLVMPLTTTASSGKKISLVTSFWAQEEAAQGEGVHKLRNSTKKYKHRRIEHRAEIEAALLTNLNNPHFHQVVVILDSATATASCTQFTERMEYLLDRYDGWISRQHKTGSSNSNNITRKPHLTCIDRPMGQPNYFEIFEYATHAAVEGDIVLVANADHAYDDTIRWAKMIKQETILVLPNSGYHESIAPKEVVQHYHFMHGVGDIPIIKNALEVPLRCYPTRSHTSWDGYVFHKDLIEGRFQAQNFKRATIIGNVLSKNTSAFFKMNAMGAETAALWSLLANIPEAEDYSACELIKSWHLHRAPKMHARVESVYSAASDETPKVVWKYPKDFDIDFIPDPRRSIPNDRGYEDAFLVNTNSSL